VTGQDYSIYDLEHLTQFAFDALAHVEQKGAGSDALTYALQVFKGVCYTADAIVRLHPKGTFYAQGGREVWNPTSPQILARVLLEACANFYYFAVSPKNEDEREFRFILANLHCAREREDSARSVEKGRPAPPPIPEDWSGLSTEEQHALLPRLKRENLPSELKFWEDQLRKNQFLPCAERRKWLEGTGLYSKKNGEYIGHRNYINAAFAGKTAHCRAKSAGIPDSVFWKLQRQFSAHAHMTPHAVDQIRGFRHVDSIGRRSLVDFPVMVSTAVLALAVDNFVKLFPECKQNLNFELELLLDYYPQVLSRSADEARREESAING